MVRREFLVTADGYDPIIRIRLLTFELFLRLVWEKAIRYANLLDDYYTYTVVHEASLTHYNKSSEILAWCSGKHAGTAARA